jgi:hypothetical protein
MFIVYFLRKLGKAAPLVFTVFDKEDILGTVTVPMAQIPSAAHRRRWMPLANKNAPSNGDLCLDCWVVSFRKSTNTWTSAFKSSFLPSSMAKERSKRRESIEMASVSLKGSHSQENLYTDTTMKTLKPTSGTNLYRTDSGQITRPLPPGPPPLIDGNDSIKPSSMNDKKQKFAFSFRPLLTPTLGQIMSGCGPPEITVVTPKHGPASGGTKVTIRGANLGTAKEDILSLSVNGSDVRSSLEWHSPAKITCKTKPWGGSGPVSIVTKSGGRGTSIVQFTYQEEKTGENYSKHNVRRNVLTLHELSWLTYQYQGLCPHVARTRQTRTYVTKRLTCVWFGHQLECTHILWRFVTVLISKNASQHKCRAFIRPGRNICYLFFIAQKKSKTTKYQDNNY